MQVGEHGDPHGRDANAKAARGACISARAASTPSSESRARHAVSAVAPTAGTPPSSSAGERAAAPTTTSVSTSAQTSALRDLAAILEQLAEDGQAAGGSGRDGGEQRVEGELR